MYNYEWYQKVRAHDIENEADPIQFTIVTLTKNMGAIE